MKWTDEQLQAYNARRDRAGHQGAGTHPGIQKQKADNAGKAHHRPSRAKMDEAVCVVFHLAIEVHVSDRRRRDLDGALATTGDCVIAARRQLESDSENDDQREGGAQG